MKGTAEVAVVGMGYVGIPLACLLARAGHQVMGIDIDDKRVEAINACKLPLLGKEPDLPELLAEQLSEGKLRASVDFAFCRQVKAIFICVDTPIDEDKIPRFDHLLAAVMQVGKNLSEGSLVVIESTIAPGTMRSRIIPILEKTSGLKAGETLFVAHCPERVMSGRLLYNLQNMDRIVGGLDDRSTEIAMGWYRKIVKGKLHPTDMTTAETVKTTENAYRDVQIAFANEVGTICEVLGLDAFEVRELVNTCPGRSMLFPGAGVGGHCLPKDSWLLAFGGKEANPRLIPLARQVNDSMPEHVAELARKLIADAGLEGERLCIAIMGLSYLEDSGDIRNAPAKTVIDSLSGEHDIIAHDPYVGSLEGVEITGDIDDILGRADCAIFMTKHQEYLSLDIVEIAKKMKHALIVDGRNIFDRKTAREAGIHYTGVGKG